MLNMTTTYDNDIRAWVSTEGFITVRGLTREGCEQRVREFEQRFKEIREENNDE